MTGPITPARAVASRPDRPRGSAGRDAAILAATPGASLEVQGTGLPGLPPRRFAAPLTAAVALVLAVTAALIFAAAVRGTGPRAAPCAGTVRKLTTRWPGPPHPAPPRTRQGAAASVAAVARRPEAPDADSRKDANNEMAHNGLAVAPRGARMVARLQSAAPPV
jgi:hypothetical protein